MIHATPDVALHALGTLMRAALRPGWTAHYEWCHIVGPIVWLRAEFRTHGAHPAAYGFSLAFPEALDESALARQVQTAAERLAAHERYDGTGWQPLTERPPADGPYLVCLRSEGHLRYVVLEWRGYWYYGQSFGPGRLVAWRALPDPPLGV